MRSRPPKVLHPLCGRPHDRCGRCWPRGRPARSTSSSSTARSGGSPSTCPRASRSRSRPSRTGPATRSPRPPARSTPARPSLVVNGDVPLITARGDRRARRRPRGRRRGRDDRDDGARRPRRLRPRRPRRRRERRARRRDQGARRRDRARSSRSARSTPASTRSTAARCSSALERLGTDNAQGERYLPDVLPLLRATSALVQAHGRSTTRRSRSASTTASTSRTCTGLAQRRIHRAPHARRRDDRRPGEHADRGGRARSGGTRVIEPSTFLRGATTIGERLPDRPADHRHRLHAGDGVSVRHSHLEGARAADGARRAVRLPAPGRAAASAGAKAGTFVEIKNSDIGAGSKVPHLSYIGDADVGDGHQPRRGARSPRTTTGSASTARRSATACRTASTPPSSRP